MVRFDDGRMRPYLREQRGPYGLNIINIGCFDESLEFIGLGIWWVIR